MRIRYTPFQVINVPAAIDPTICRVSSFDGASIVYDFYDAGAPRIAVIVPGFWRDRGHSSMRTLAALALEHGRSVAVIDTRGHGESEGTYGFNRDEHRDVACVLEAIVRAHPGCPIDLIGLSMGGAISVSTLARHPELPVESLFLISPVAEFKTIAPRLNLLTMHRHISFRQAFRKPRFDWNFRKSEKLRAVDDVTAVHVPIALLHMRNDWLIDHKHSEALYENANEPKEMHLLDLPGSFHADRIFAVAGAQAREILLDFWERIEEKKAALARG